MFTKLEQRFWIKIEVARGHNTQEFFQGLREALGGREPHHSSWQCKESHRCSCLGHRAPLAMGDSGTSTVLTRYESMRLRSLGKSETTTARYPTQHKRWTYSCYRAVNTEHNKDGRADGVRRLPNIFQKVINKEKTTLKVHKCCTHVNKAMSEISNCCHFFLVLLLHFRRKTRLSL